MEQFVTLYLLDRNRVGVSSGGDAAHPAGRADGGAAPRAAGVGPARSTAWARSRSWRWRGSGWCRWRWAGACWGRATCGSGSSSRRRTVLWTGVEVANFNLVLEMSGSRRRQREGGGSAYVAVNSVIINIAGCLGGLVAGLIAQGLKDWHWAPLVGAKAVQLLRRAVRPERRAAAGGGGGVPPVPPRADGALGRWKRCGSSSSSIRCAVNGRGRSARWRFAAQAAVARAEA